MSRGRIRPPGRLALALLAAFVSGCASVPSGPSPVHPSLAGQQGLPGQPEPAEHVVALVGTVGAMSIVLPGPTTAGSRGAPPGRGLPPDAAWVSGEGSTLLATTRGGEAALEFGLSEQAWVGGPGDLGGSHPGRAFGSLQPVLPGGKAAGAARRVAFVEGDPGSGGAGRLIVETLAGTGVRRFALPSPAESAPSWLPDGRIALVVRDRRDQPEVVLIDPATGGTDVLAMQAVRSLAVGGGMVATVGADGVVRAGPVADWLAGEALLPVGSGSPAEAAVQAQPAPSGTELAIVLADAAGDAASIHTLAAAGGWHEIARFVLPVGANRAVVSWLAVP